MSGGTDGGSTLRASWGPSVARRIASVLGRAWLRVGMILSIGAVLGAASWSAAREVDAALAEFSHEQAILAAVVGIDFENRLTSYVLAAGDEDQAAFTDDVVLELLSGARRIEERGDVMVLVSRPGQQGFLTTDRRVIPSTRLRRAIDQDVDRILIPRGEAPAFGLPHRIAVAGLARVVVHDRGTWGVIVLASAHRLRARERHELWRLALTAGVVTGLVLALGGVAQRRERRRLELERQIEVSSLEREREAALAKADKMAAMAALSTGIAHELGTPLSIIVERIDQAAERAASDERALALLRIVNEQVARIQRIVRASLALARGDTPYLVETEPASVASKAGALVRHRFDKAGVSLASAIDEDLPRIACEPSLFEQALVNLLLNACEASARGATVTLAVRAAGAEVSFVVEDEGQGIPDAALEQATAPFFSTKRHLGGSGLGLTIAREIVSHHAGTLELERRGTSGGTRATIRVKRG